MIHIIRRLLPLAILLPLLAGCPDEPSTPPHRAPTAGPGQHREPAGQQPAPVQGDPSAHNTQAGEVDLHVEWTSENSATPVCEWSKNGAVRPCANMRKAVKDHTTDYIGLWEREDRGSAGDVFTIAATGNPGVKSIECAIAWKGKYHAGTSNGRRCGISFTLD